MRNSDPTGLGGVLELVVATFYSDQLPALLLQLFDQVFAIHCNDYTHLYTPDNTHRRWMRPVHKQHADPKIRHNLGIGAARNDKGPGVETSRPLGSDPNIKKTQDWGQTPEGFDNAILIRSSITTYANKNGAEKSSTRGNRDFPNTPPTKV